MTCEYHSWPAQISPAALETKAGRNSLLARGNRDSRRSLLTGSCCCWGLRSRNGLTRCLLSLLLALTVTLLHWQETALHTTDLPLVANANGLVRHAREARTEEVLRREVVPRHSGRCSRHLPQELPARLESITHVVLEDASCSFVCRQQSSPQVADDAEHPRSRKAQRGCETTRIIIKKPKSKRTWKFFGTAGHTHVMPAFNGK